MTSSPFERVEDNFATLTIHSGYDPEDMTHMPIVCPLVMTSTYKHFKPGQYDKYYYGRIGNPNRNNLEKTLAAIENAKFATTYPTGMGAVTGIASIFSPGDHFVVSNDIYGGTMKYFVKRAPRQGIHVDYADFTDLEDLKDKLKPETKMIWFETPTNPTLSVVDIKAVCDIAKGIAKDVVIVIDNTFLTAYFQKPLELGVDISMYSIAKYLNGHSDVVMGAAVTNSEKLYKELSDIQTVCGLCPSPFDCYQVTRGMKTLALRLDQHHKNSMAIAKYLQTNPYVTKVNHPGLESHPSHKLALRQSSGHSGIMSFCIKGGLTEVEKFMDNLKVIHLAASLGGVETLVAAPALMTHDMISQEKRETMGITDSLVRLSVGIESAKDLIADLEQALKAAYV